MSFHLILLDMRLGTNDSNRIPVCSDILSARETTMTIKALNKDLFFARAYYFTFMGGRGFILPFANLFYISLGLSGKQIGTIGSLSSIVGLVISPILVTEIKKLSGTQRASNPSCARRDRLCATGTANGFSVYPGHNLLSCHHHLRHHAYLGFDGGLGLPAGGDGIWQRPCLGIPGMDRGGLVRWLADRTGRVWRRIWRRGADVGAGSSIALVHPLLLFRCPKRYRARQTKLADVCRS